MAWRAYYVSTFSGIEAATVAWAPLGWVPVCFSEIGPFPSAVLEERFPPVPNLGDITRIDWSDLSGFVDIVVGGSPCQSFSVAGNREGLSGESGLMWEYVRAVREIRPEWLLWENVPGALSSSNGEDFRCLLESLDALGYGLAWRVLDAQFFGVAQRRERVFLVGRLGDVEGPCQVLFESESLRWDSPSSKDKRKALAAGAGIGSKTAGFCAGNTAGAGSIGYQEEVSPTLRGGASGTNMVPAVCIKGDIARGARMGQGGKGWSDDGSCYTLTTVDVPAVIAPVIAFNAGNANDVECAGAGPEGLCPTLRSSPSGTNQVPVVAFSRDVSGSRGGPGPDSGPSAVTDGYVVRRLMPVECERLQGFPDGWTRVPYRGKPAEECPDTPRYKALGNSMAVPVMRWIGERIQEVMDREETEE